MWPSPRASRYVRERRGVLHRNGLDINRRNENAALSRDRVEQVRMVLNVFLSQYDEISSAPANAIERDASGTVKCTLGRRRKKRSVFSVCLELELRRVSQKNVS